MLVIIQTAFGTMQGFNAEIQKLMMRAGFLEVLSNFDTFAQDEANHVEVVAAIVDSGIKNISDSIYQPYEKLGEMSNLSMSARKDAQVKFVAACNTFVERSSLRAVRLRSAPPHSEPPSPSRRLDSPVVGSAHRHRGSGDGLQHAAWERM